jgi:hypothetical protein
LPAAEFANWQPSHLYEVVSVPTAARDRLSEVEMRFIEAILGEPGKQSGFYAKKARMNGASAAAVRARLVTLGYLREHSVATGRRGRMSIVLEPLDKALAATAQKLAEEQP